MTWASLNTAEPPHLDRLKFHGVVLRANLPRVQQEPEDLRVGPCRPTLARAPGTVPAVSLIDRQGVIFGTLKTCESTTAHWSGTKSRPSEAICDQRDGGALAKTLSYSPVRDTLDAKEPQPAGSAPSNSAFRKLANEESRCVC